MITKNLQTYWHSLEKKYPPPRFVKKITNLDFKDLKNAIDNKEEKYLKKIIKNMYVNREAYILKNAAPKNFKETILKLADFYKKKRKSTFKKMLDGSPNFHRIIDKSITKKYSLYAIKHSFYFYNWNIKSKLEKKLKDGAYRHWRYIKFLAGNKKKSFEKNIPSDGQIDRLQVVRYPAGGGQLRDHVDPRKNQRVVTGLIMGKIGKDFTKGGFYFKSSKNKNINIENRLDVGDAVIFYGSIAHGVQPVDPHEKLIWKSNKGRWFVGMFVNDSDHIKNRITAKDITGSIKKKFN
tara:strand:+ start:663 stop:1541 length:879 start_codon:yes stop_codon:yes gene_type:complete